MWLCVFFYCKCLFRKMTGWLMLRPSLTSNTNDFFILDRSQRYSHNWWHWRPLSQVFCGGRSHGRQVTIRFLRAHRLTYNDFDLCWENREPRIRNATPHKNYTPTTFATPLLTAYQLIYATPVLTTPWPTYATPLLTTSRRSYAKPPSMLHLKLMALQRMSPDQCCGSGSAE
jgi:hypothetical protein